MSDAKCPNCSAVLAQRELNDGWCGDCGRRVPMFVYHQAGLKGPKEQAMPAASHVPSAASMQLDPEEKLPVWQIALLGLAIVGIAAVIVGAFI